MTREEQIVEAAKDSEKQMGFGKVPSSYGIGFLKGAIWADEHPDLYSVIRKAVEGERKHLIDKICKWLDEEMEDYVERFNEDDVQPIVISGSYDYKKDFIEALRKAMEEQQ